MSRFFASAFALTAMAVFAFAGYPNAASTPRPGIDWPQFRGIQASGIADTHPTPSTWSIAEGEGVAWKTPIPGLGLSSPVVWGDLVCVTTSIGGQKDAGLRVGLGRFGVFGEVRKHDPINRTVTVIGLTF